MRAAPQAPVSSLNHTSGLRRTHFETLISAAMHDLCTNNRPPLMNTDTSTLAYDKHSQAAKDLAQEAAANARDAAQQAGYAAKDLAQHAANTVKETAQNGYSAAKEAAQNGYTAAKDATQNGYSAAKDAVQNAGQAARDLYQSAAHRAEDLYHSAAHRAEDLYHTAAARAEQTLDQSKKYVRENPVPSVLGAFALGLTLGALLGLSHHHQPTLRERFRW